MLRAIVHHIQVNLHWRKNIYLWNLKEGLQWDFFFPFFFLVLQRYLVTITTQDNR